MCTSLSAFAQGEFSLQDYNPRSAATGACSALYSSAFNPMSGIKLEALASYAKDGEYTRAAFAATDRLSFNLDGFGKKNRAIQFKDDFGAPTGEEFSPSRFFLSAGTAYLINEWLSAGVQGRFLKEDLSPQNAHRNFAGEFSLCARKNNFTGALCYNSFPSNMALAAQYSVALNELHTIKALAQYRYYNAGTSQLGIGTEYGFADAAFLRAGYNYGGKSPVPDFLSLGVGGRFGGFALDLSYQYNLEARTSIIRIGVGLFKLRHKR